MNILQKREYLVAVFSGQEQIIYRLLVEVLSAPSVSDSLVNKLYNNYMQDKETYIKRIVSTSCKKIEELKKAEE